MKKKRTEAFKLWKGPFRHLQAFRGKCLASTRSSGHGSDDARRLWVGIMASSSLCWAIAGCLRAPQKGCYRTERQEFDRTGKKWRLSLEILVLSIFRQTSKDHGTVRTLQHVRTQMACKLGSRERRHFWHRAPRVR